MYPEEAVYILNRFRNRHIGQCFQHHLMISLSWCCTGVENSNHAAVGFSSDGTAKALPQFDLHFRHDFSLDITVQIAVLLPHGFSQRVGYLKWQLHNDEQGDHISGEIHTFPARSTGEQDGVGKLFEAFQIDLWVALCLQHRHRELIFQFFIDTAHLIVDVNSTNVCPLAVLISSWI